MSETWSVKRECQRVGGTWKNGLCRQPQSATTPSNPDGEPAFQPAISRKQALRIATVLRRAGVRQVVLVTGERLDVSAKTETLTPEEFVEFLQSQPRELL